MSHTCGNGNLTKAKSTIRQSIGGCAGDAYFKGLCDTGPALDELWLNLAYTLNDFRFDNDMLYGNNVLPGAPRHYLRAELLYKHANGFYIGPNLEWVPESYYVDSATTVKTEPYAIWGLNAGVDNAVPVSAYVEACRCANPG